MKKIVFVVIVGVALLLTGCKKTITTQYTIGCLGYQLGSIQGTNWDELQSYFSSHVDYNKLITFESTSLAENDAKARQHFDEQIKKLDTAYVCTLLSSSDYFDYGIATQTKHGEYQYIKVMRFETNGSHLLDVN